MKYISYNTLGATIYEKTKDFNKETVLQFSDLIANNKEELKTNILNNIYYKDIDFIESSAIINNVSAWNGKLYITKLSNKYSGKIIIRPQYRMDKKTQAETLSIAKSLLTKLSNIYGDFFIKGDNFKKIGCIYAYLAKTVKYKTSKQFYNEYGTPYAALANKEANCLGYALAFHMLCTLSEIPCIVVTSKPKQDNNPQSNTHAFNIVKISDKWYFCDCCWDAGKKAKQWKYFLQAYNQKWKRNNNNCLDNNHYVAEMFSSQDFVKRYPYVTDKEYYTFDKKLILMLAGL